MSKIMGAPFQTEAGEAINSLYKENRRKNRETDQGDWCKRRTAKLFK